MSNIGAQAELIYTKFQDEYGAIRRLVALHPGIATSVIVAESALIAVRFVLSFF